METGAPRCTVYGLRSPKVVKQEPLGLASFPQPMFGRDPLIRDAYTCPLTFALSLSCLGGGGHELGPDMGANTVSRVISYPDQAVV